MNSHNPVFDFSSYNALIILIIAIISQNVIFTVRKVIEYDS